MLLIDPTRLFSIIVLVIMWFRFLQAHDFSFDQLVEGFLLNPYVDVFTLISVVTLIMAKPSEKSKVAPLSNSDLMTLEWYFWNSFLYHGIMDGASGTFQLVPVVVSEYQYLDKRFATHHVVPWLVGAVELFVMFPLCLATLYCIRQRSVWRYPLEIITSVMHIFGMVMFVAAEVYEGQRNVPAMDPVGIPGDRWGNVQFTNLYHLIFYWFGFWICNLIWGVVPMIRIVSACQHIAGQLKKSKQE